MLAKPGLSSAETPAGDPHPRLAKSKKRRRDIVAALRRSMLDKGYAETSITDIANSAGLSVSHLLYYYRSKDMILDELCAQVVDKILIDVTLNRDEPPEERIHVLADNVFLHGAIHKSELGILREIMALSMHRAEIRAQLGRYNDEMMGYLEDLFSKTPRQPGTSAADAAEIAAALWMGLVNNAGYHETLDNSRARRLFRRMLLSLANLDPQAGAVQASPRAPRKPRRKTPP